MTVYCKPVLDGVFFRGTATYLIQDGNIPLRQCQQSVAPSSQDLENNVVTFSVISVSEGNDFVQKDMVQSARFATTLS